MYRKENSFSLHISFLAILIHLIFFILLAFGELCLLRSSKSQTSCVELYSKNIFVLRRLRVNGASKLS